MNKNISEFCGKLNYIYDKYYQETPANIIDTPHKRFYLDIVRNMMSGQVKLTQDTHYIGDFVTYNGQRVKIIGQLQYIPPDPDIKFNKEAKDRRMSLKSYTQLRDFYDNVLRIGMNSLAVTDYRDTLKELRKQYGRKLIPHELFASRLNNTFTSFSAMFPIKLEGYRANATEYLKSIPDQDTVVFCNPPFVLEYMDELFKMIVRVLDDWTKNNGHRLVFYVVCPVWDPQGLRIIMSYYANHYAINNNEIYRLADLYFKDRGLYNKRLQKLGIGRTRAFSYFKREYVELKNPNDPYNTYVARLTKSKYIDNAEIVRFDQMKYKSTSREFTNIANTHIITLSSRNVIN